MSTSYVIKRNHINSDLLADAVENDITFMVEMSDLSDEVSRESFLSSVDYILTQLFIDGTIDTYKVIADKRNNSRQELSSGKVRMDVTYKEKNCLNVSSISFFFEAASLEDYETLTF